MKLIVGLGNPGIEYANSRHNVGFKIIDKMTEKLNIKLNKEKFDGKFYVTSDFIIAKPLTFMNNSGNFVSKIANFYNIQSEDIMIIHDEIDLDFGKAIIRVKGGANGQNGVKSIIEIMKTTDFLRLKVGVGRNKYNPKDVVNHVLGNFNPEETILLEKIINICAEAMISFLFNDIRYVLNLYTQDKLDLIKK